MGATAIVRAAALVYVWSASAWSFAADRVVPVRAADRRTTDVAFASPAARPASHAPRPTPARTAELRGDSDAPLRVQPADWSGYRGIRRYSPYYYPTYAPYPPFYYGHYVYRPWYARPYAYAYGYPAYAPPIYRYPIYPYRGWVYGYGPYAWGGLYPPAIAAPAVVSPQVFWTPPAADADDAGCFYW